MPPICCENNNQNNNKNLPCKIKKKPQFRSQHVIINDEIRLVRPERIYGIISSNYYKQIIETLQTKFPPGAWVRKPYLLASMASDELNPVSVSSAIYCWHREPSRYYIVSSENTQGLLIKAMKNKWYIRYNDGAESSVDLCDNNKNNNITDLFSTSQ